MTSVTDARGNSTIFEYDSPANGLPNRVKVNPLNGTGVQTTSTAYDIYTSLVTSQTDANGKVTTFDYTNQLTGTADLFGRPGIVYSPAVSINGVNQRRKVVTIYEDSLRRVTVTSDLNAEGDGLLKSRSTQDQMGRTTLVEQSEDGSTYTVSSQTVFEQAGKVTFQSNPHRAASASTDGWTRSTSDLLGRVTEVATFSGSTRPAANTPCDSANNCTGRVLSSYSSNQTTVTDQAGKSRRSETDALGRLVKVIEDPQPQGLNLQTLYAYDVLNNLVSVVHGEQTRTFTYSSLSRLATATNPESGTISYLYDQNGNLVQKVDARNVLTSYGYDALNRLVSRLYSEKSPGVPWSPQVTYIYDTLVNGKGRLTKVTTSGVSETSCSGYDALGRITGSTQLTDGVAYQMNYQYDLVGNLILQQYPSGKVVLTEHDSAARIAGVKKYGGDYYAGATPSDNVNRIQYAAHGGIKALKLGNGLWEHVSFNTRLQPTLIGLGTTQNGVDRLKLEYGYGTTNNNGNVQSQTITVPGGPTLSQSYVYDSLNRIDTANEIKDGAQVWKQDFEYDRFGNRTFNTSNTTANVLGANPAINSNNNRINATGYVYDSVGNLINDPSHTYAYDGENKMVANDGGANPNSGVAASYFYDGDGKRIKKIVGITSTIFVYNIEGQLVAEYSNQASSGNGISYLTVDTLTSTRIVTDSSGTVKSRHDFLPFGEELQAGIGGRTQSQGYSQASGNRKKWATYERDEETGLDYAQARYYSNWQGRFTSPDPTLLSANGFNPQTWNRYVYVLNNPLAYVDPLGLWALNFNPVYKKKDGKETTEIDHYVAVVTKTKADDDAASLADQLGLKGKAAEKFVKNFGEKLADGKITDDNVQISKLGGEVGRIFGIVQGLYSDQKKHEAGGGTDGPTHGIYADCSSTSFKLAFPSEDISGSNWSVFAADNFIENRGLKSISEAELRIGDIVRYATGKDNTPAHFTTFIFRDDSGVPMVFSRSGRRGPFEYGSASSGRFQNATYGTIRGRGKDPTGFYSRGR